ncbi:IMP 5'-nucleotidase [Neurospora sp. IMI 360204]|nr:IMP 5'-nucleotidase [Neurospora sp. IMI 360204]
MANPNFNHHNHLFAAAQTDQHENHPTSLYIDDAMSHGHQDDKPGRLLANSLSCADVPGPVDVERAVRMYREDAAVRSRVCHDVF